MSTTRQGSAVQRMLMGGVVRRALQSCRGCRSRPRVGMIGDTVRRTWQGAVRMAM